ncbi:MAG: hypothetical protein ABFD69_08630 [Candidatus Sumerlaeia bacterium]
MKKSLLMITLCLLAAGCSPIRKKVVTEPPYVITRTYFLGVPVSETKKWSEDPVPSASADRMRRMEQEMRDGSSILGAPAKGPQTP